MVWIARGAALALLVFVSTACSQHHFDPSGQKYRLEESQRRYTNLVRWGEIEAASAYVDPGRQEAFLAWGDAFEGIRITDYDAGVPQYETPNLAKVEVTYHAYSMRTFVEKKIRTKQEWYRTPDIQDDWRVRPEIERIVAAVVEGGL